MLKRRLLAALLSAAMLLPLASCGKDKRALEQAVREAQALRDSYESEGSLHLAREAIAAAQCMCGAMYIGYVEDESMTLRDNRVFYETLLKESGAAERFAFVKEIPDERFVSTKMGHELYLIIPRSKSQQVVVNRLALEDMNEYTSDTLYASPFGEPFLLQCNYSDIFSDAQVVITDLHDEHLRWSPFLSLKDGRLQTQAEDGKKVYDFTKYPSDADGDD